MHGCDSALLVHAINAVVAAVMQCWDGGGGMKWERRWDAGEDRDSLAWRQPLGPGEPALSRYQAWSHASGEVLKLGQNMIGLAF